MLHPRGAVLTTVHLSADQGFVEQSTIKSSSLPDGCTRASGAETGPTRSMNRYKQKRLHSSGGLGQHYNRVKPFGCVSDSETSASVRR